MFSSDGFINMCIIIILDLKININYNVKKTRCQDKFSMQPFYPKIVFNLI